METHLIFLKCRLTCQGSFIVVSGYLARSSRSWVEEHILTPFIKKFD